MKLIQDDAGFRLCNEGDDLLASGSDLPAILDALDGGVAEFAGRQPYGQESRRVAF